MQVSIYHKIKLVVNYLFFFEFGGKSGGRKRLEKGLRKKCAKSLPTKLKEVKNVLKIMSLYLDTVLPSVCMLMRREIPGESS